MKSLMIGSLKYQKIWFKLIKMDQNQNNFVMSYISAYVVFQSIFFIGVYNLFILFIEK